MTFGESGAFLNKRGTKLNIFGFYAFQKVGELMNYIEKHFEIFWTTCETWKTF